VALRSAGVGLVGVEVLTGPDGLRRLDPQWTRHRLRARLLRLAQTGAYEHEVVFEYEQAIRAGGSVVLVPAAGLAERDRVAAVLRAQGGHGILYFRRWTIEQLPG
jgi:hypothetical protein